MPNQNTHPTCLHMKGVAHWASGDTIEMNALAQDDCVKGAAA